MAASLRLVYRRSLPRSAASSTKPSASSPPSTLGSKLQRLALLAPEKLLEIELLADLMLTRVTNDKLF